MVHNNTLCVEMFDNSKFIMNDVVGIKSLDSELRIEGGYLGKERIIIGASLEDVKTLEIFRNFNYSLKVTVCVTEESEKANFCSDQVVDFSITNKIVKIFCKNKRGTETEHDFVFSDFYYIEVVL